MNLQRNGFRTEGYVWLAISESDEKMKATKKLLKAVVEEPGVSRDPNVKNSENTEMLVSR